MTNPRKLSLFDKVFFCYVILIFVLIATIDFFTKSQWFFDSIVAFTGLFLAYDLYKWRKISLEAVFLMSMHLIIHTMNLYSVSIFDTGYKFDALIHGFGGFMGAVIFFQLIKNNLKGPYFRTAIYAITILATMGGGSIIEIVEYAGKIFLGEGDGLFFYGVGDYGDWGNAIQDMVFNGVGAVFFILLLIIDNGNFYKKYLEHD